MIDNFLIVRDSDGFIYGMQAMDSVDAGPVIPQLECPIAGAHLVPYSAGFTRAGRADSERAYWIDGAVQWRDTRTLDDLRAAKNAAINTWKLEANSSYFEFGGKKIAYKDADRVEIQAINNVVLLTGAMPTHPDWPKAWKAIDNTWVPLPDLQAWTDFNLAIAARGTAHFKRAQDLKAALARATTPADIDAITW